MPKPWLRSGSQGLPYSRWRFNMAAYSWVRHHLCIRKQLILMNEKVFICMQFWFDFGKIRILWKQYLIFPLMYCLSLKSLWQFGSVLCLSRGSTQNTKLQKLQFSCNTRNVLKRPPCLKQIWGGQRGKLLIKHVQMVAAYPGAFTSSCLHPSLG